MPIEVHSEYLQRRFVAKFWSFACLINFLIIAGATILPLYIAWASHSFWIKEDLRWEQPMVQYKNSLLVAVHGLKGVSNPVPFTLAWTTSPAANDMLQATLKQVRNPIVKSSVLDHNYDARPDALKIKISMPLEADEVVLSAAAFAWVDVELNSATRASFDGLLYLTAGGSGVRGSAAYIDGDFSLHQRDAIPCPPSGVFSPYLRSPLTQPEAAANAGDMDATSILSEYLERNITVALHPVRTAWIPDDVYMPVVPGSAADLSSLAIKARSFDLTVQARIPPTDVRVRPGVAEELKHGWIQYVSFLAVTAVAAWLLRSFIFGYKIIETSVFVDAPRSKVHIE